MTDSVKLFGLLDCNSFFASCEKLFRPDLAGQPVVVLSNNDGVVIARSLEAKQLGIKMGEPFFKLKRFIRYNQLVVFSSNYRLYGDLSSRVMQMLHHWTPHVELYSIDEAFLDLTGLDLTNLDSTNLDSTGLDSTNLGLTNPGLTGLGEISSVLDRKKSDQPTIDSPTVDRFMSNVVQTVKKWTGIPVSFGIGPTKTLAKVANDLAKKKQGVCCLIDLDERNAALARLSIADVWGIGRHLAPKMQRLGIRTARDLAQIDPLWIRKEFSIVQEQLVRELNGECCLDVQNTPTPRKTIQVSRSFHEPVDDYTTLSEAVATFAARASEKAREDGTVASAVYVHLNTSRFNGTYLSEGRAIGFATPTSQTTDVIRSSLELLRALYRPDTPYKKAMVMLLDLRNARAMKSQGMLFERDDKDPAIRERDERLIQSVDEINRQYGKGTLFFGSQGTTQKWRGSFEYSSPAYTTFWGEIPLVKAK
ncbi:MAG: Y-family DNA polymerase [Thermoguttaceae bacterium]